MPSPFPFAISHHSPLISHHSTFTQTRTQVYSRLNQTPGKLKAVFLQNFTTPNHGPDGKIDPRLATTASTASSNPNPSPNPNPNPNPYPKQAHIFYGSGTVSVKNGL